MKSPLRGVLFALLFTCTTQISSAQYYSWGSDRASLRWSKIVNDRLAIVYPDSVESTARRMMHYLDAMQGSSSYGFEYSALNIPFVVHAENFASNGMVMWMPKRVEFLSTPAIDSYSMPWVKQLVAHEYRHAVQYNNLDRSTSKVISYILGQQGAAVSLLFPPLYALEGDAVMIETAMSSYGRGMQPSFSMGYRALADELMDKKSYLKWRCGSFTESVPDHYRMGYQILSYAYDKYNENILDSTFRYIARNPQFISPYSIALRKYYDTSTKELFYETFGLLKDYWEPQNSVENSSEIISHGGDKNFTQYLHPMQLPNGEILALKYDYRDPTRFVVFNPEECSEEEVAHTGSISSRPAYAAGRVWWSEYRRSALFAECVGSQICYMDLESGKPKSYKGYKSALYPTPIGESVDHIAIVEYNPTGQYSVVELKDGKRLSSINITYPNEVHAMAWDNLTERLYIIVTGDDGMWIEQQTESGFEPLTKAAYITISDLRAQDGTLYFGSIASGKDEVHSLDIATGVEIQLSESKYGSFQPILAGDDIYMTTYDKSGYHLARQSREERVAQLEYSQLPKNVLNPERERWDVINLDSVKFNSVDLLKSSEEHPDKKYRKISHLFNLHSWAPIRFDPFNILNEMSLDIGLGATLISQNLLSSCESYLSYGWDHYQGSIFRGGVKYDGLGVNLSLTSTYGGDQNLYYITEQDVGRDLKRYADVNFSASLPLYFNRGYKNHAVTPYVSWSYSNGIVPTGLDYEYAFDPGLMQTYLKLKYRDLSTGLNKLSFGATYSNYVQSAYRDLATPLGYTLSANFALDPFNSEFSQLMSFYGKLYTPGLAKNNSFTVALAYQDLLGGFRIDGSSMLGYSSSLLVPHGFSYLDVSADNYFAASAEYKLPICYPDLGVLNLLYFKRISLGVGADYAQFRKFSVGDQSIYSYGADLIFDLNAISMTSASTITLTTSFYMPKGRPLYFKFGLGLPF